MDLNFNYNRKQSVGSLGLLAFVELIQLSSSVRFTSSGLQNISVGDWTWATTPAAEFIIHFFFNYMYFVQFCFRYTFVRHLFSSNINLFFCRPQPKTERTYKKMRWHSRWTRKIKSIFVTWEHIKQWSIYLNGKKNTILFIRLSLSDINLYLIVFFFFYNVGRNWSVK